MRTLGLMMCGLSDEAPALVSDMLAAQLRDAGLTGAERLLAHFGLQTVHFIAHARAEVFEEACTAAGKSSWGAGHIARFRELRSLAQKEGSDCNGIECATGSLAPEVSLADCAVQICTDGCDEEEDWQYVGTESTHAARKLIHQCCQSARDNHRPEHKQAATKMIRQELGQRFSQRQVVEWVQEFNYELLSATVPRIDGCSSAAADIVLSLSDSHGNCETIIQAVLAAQNHETEYREVLAALQDLLNGACCLEVGIADSDGLQLALTNAFGGELPHGLDMQMSFHSSLGFLPGAFQSKNRIARSQDKRVRKPRIRQAKAKDMAYPGGTMAQHFQEHNYAEMIIMVSDIKASTGFAGQCVVGLSGASTQQIADAVAATHKAKESVCRLARLLEDILVGTFCLKTCPSDVLTLENTFVSAFGGAIPEEAAPIIVGAYLKRLSSFSLGPVAPAEKSAAVTDPATQSIGAFVPVEVLSFCPPSWQVKADALHRAIIDETSGPDVCESCMGSLGQLLLELQWLELPAPTAKCLSGKFAELIVSASSRFPNCYKVQETCVTVLLEFCRHRKICLGIAEEQPACPAFEPGVCNKILGMVSDVINDQDDSLWLQTECYHLLARTQSFTTVRDFANENTTMLHNVLSEVLEALRHHLEECDWRNPIYWGNAPSPQCHERNALSRELLMEVARQRSQEDSCQRGIQWVQKEYRYTEQRLRLFIVGLLLPLERDLLLPVSQTRDETVLWAAYQAIPDVWFFLEPDDQRRVRLCLFGWEQYGRTYEPHQTNVQSALTKARAVVLRGVAAVRPLHDSIEDDDGAKFLEQAVHDVLSTMHSTSTWIDWVSKCNDGLWALDEFFADADDYGEWEDQICNVAEYCTRHVDELFATGTVGESCVKSARNILRRRRPQQSWPMGE